jgi:DNA-binding NtrC family response regulator
MDHTVVIVEGAARGLLDRLRAAGCTVESREAGDPLDELSALPGGARIVLLHPPRTAPVLVAPGERRESGLRVAERELISRTLADAGGNVSEAARRLGLHRQSLQRKLRRLRAGARP